MQVGVFCKYMYKIWIQNISLALFFVANTSSDLIAQPSWITSQTFLEVEISRSNFSADTRAAK